MEDSYRHSIQVPCGEGKRERRVGYCLHETTDPHDCHVAIVWFYPLSGASIVLEHAAPSLNTYQCHVLSVDRPGVGDSDLLEHEESVLDRIQGHAQDVLAVLRHHNLKQVYIMAVCLGHVYAVQVARQLLAAQKVNDDSLPTLNGLTLVAPFVSPACPHSWRIARLGAAVPSFVLSAATYSMTSLGSSLLPYFLTPERFESFLDEQHQKEFGWTKQDFEHACQLAQETNQMAKRTKHIEANLGANPSWQQILDDFSLESDIGLVVEDTVEEKVNTTNRGGPFPITIRATEPDKIAPWESVQWVARRNYGNVQVQKELRIQSHEGMVFLGGPPRNPVLLHEIAQEWGLRASIT